jgi:hypothetical protein
MVTVSGQLAMALLAIILVMLVALLILPFPFY